MESFKTIKNFNNYAISNFGRVINNDTDEIIKPILKKKLYLVVRLEQKGLTIEKYIHFLIAEHFIINPHNYNYVIHKNDIKTDNREQNLIWSSNPTTKFKAIFIKNGITTELGIFNSKFEAQKAKEEAILNYDKEYTAKYEAIKNIIENLKSQFYTT